MYAFVGALLLASSVLLFYWGYVEHRLPDSAVHKHGDSFTIATVCAVLGLFTAGCVVLGHFVEAALREAYVVLDGGLALAVVAGTVVLVGLLRRRLATRHAAASETVSPPANDVGPRRAA
jgi:hypothetical protein